MKTTQLPTGFVRTLRGRVEGVSTILQLPVREGITAILGPPVLGLFGNSRFSKNICYIEALETSVARGHLDGSVS